MAMSAPNAHEASESRALSISICWINRPRPAPIDMRSAISRSRDAARATSRLATLSRR